MVNSCDVYFTTTSVFPLKIKQLFEVGGQYCKGKRRAQGETSSSLFQVMFKAHVRPLRQKVPEEIA